MTTTPMRPAVVLVWVLGLTLLLARPQITVVILAAVNWTLTAPAGAWILGAAFIGAVACALRGTFGWTR